MATFTTNYNLKKPATTDTYNILDANGNMDTIDTNLKSAMDYLKNLLTTKGDIPYASANNTPSRLGVGTDNQILKSLSGVPVWSTLMANGTFSDTTTTIPSLSSIVKTIPLGITAKRGRILMKTYNGSGVFVMFTTNTADAIGICVSSGSYSAVTKGYSVLGNKLADGFSQGSPNYIDLREAKINGTNLELNFYNYNATTQQALGVFYATWEVEA